MGAWSVISGYGSMFPDRLPPPRPSPARGRGGQRSDTVLILRRLAGALPSIVGVIVVTFLLTRALPGDPAAYFAGPAATQQAIEEIRHKLGLDRSLPAQFVDYLGRLAHGDLGTSLTTGQPVSDDLLTRLPASAELTLLGLLLSVAVAVPLGIAAAARPGSWVDHLCRVVSTAGVSLPTFFTGLLLILIFSVNLGWLPFVYRADLQATGWQWWWESIKQAIMPITVLGLYQAASYTRYVRSAVLDVIKLDYVTTARAKGLDERKVIVKHVVRNALIPVVTLVALQMPTVFGGAIVTEQIFRIPGIGSLLISAILANDTPVIMAVTFVFACLVVLFNLIADILYGWLDPRISFR